MGGLKRQLATPTSLRISDEMLVFLSVLITRVLVRHVNNPQFMQNARQNAK